MTVLDTFTHEAGNLSEYSGTTNDSGNTTDAHASAALTGSFGLRTILVNSYNAKAYKDITFPASGVLAVRFQFKVVAQSVSLGAEMIVFALWDLANGLFNKARIINASGTYQLNVKKRDASDVVIVNLSTQPTTGTLHTMEIVFDRTTHTTTAYLNDAQVAQVVDPSVTGTDAFPDRFIVGMEDNGGSPTGTIYYDNVEYGDARIGSGGGGGGGSAIAAIQRAYRTRRVA